MLATAKKAAAEVVQSPTTLLSAGNVLLAAGTAEPVGIGLNAATCLSTVGLKVYESVTGQKIGLPYYVLAAVNAVSAGSVLVAGANDIGVDGLAEFSAESLKYVLSAGAFANWSIGHAVAGYNEAHEVKTRGVLNNEQTWYGVGDLSAVQANPYSSAFFGVGLVRALSGVSGEVEDVTTLGDFMRKHLTSARFYGCGYLLGALLTLDNPGFAGAQAAWGLGYLNFDAAKNTSFLSDLGKVIGLGYADFAKVVAQDEAFTFRVRNGRQNLRDIILTNFGILDRLKLNLGFDPQGLWDRAGETALELYRSPLTKKSRDKNAVFAVLEGIACKSLMVRQEIGKMADEGDPRSVAKMRRLGRLIGNGFADHNPNAERAHQSLAILRSLGLQ